MEKLIMRGRHIKEDRRKNAEMRQIEYNGLSLEEKIARAKGRRGNSSKELARLESLLKKK